MELRKIVYFIFLLLLVMLCSCNNNSDIWKDTHKVLGDGTYQIFNHTDDGIKIKGISNSKCHQCIVDKIIAMNETEQSLYVYGKFTEHDVYAVIDLNNNKAKYFAVLEKDDVLGMTNINDLINSETLEILENFDDFDESEKEILENLKM